MAQRSWRIRQAELADFEGWFALYESVAAEGVWIGGEAPSDRIERQKGFERYLASEFAMTLLAETDEQLIGSVGVEISRGVASLGMMVDARWREQGVRSALLAACITWSDERGAHKIALEVWPHNAAAIALYEKFGFVEEARLRRHYRRRNGELWDAIGMGLVIDQMSPGSSIP